MILIIRQFDGNQVWARLCYDGKFRNFANFGTFNECVKTYKSRSASLKCAKRCKALAVQIPDGMEVTAVGDVLEYVPAGEGYERVVHHHLADFQIPG